MKKILLVLTLVLSMVFTVTISTLAAGMYFDTMLNGSWEGSIGEGDANDTYIGVEIPVNDFKINLELLTGNWEIQNQDIDFNGYEIKGAYRVMNNRDLQVFVSLCNYNREFDNSEEFSGILVGANGVIFLTKKINLEGSVDISLTGKYDSDLDSDNDAELLHSRVKLNYELVKNLYASIGYRYYRFETDSLNDTVKDKGLTIGLKYNF